MLRIISIVALRYFLSLVLCLLMIGVAVIIACFNRQKREFLTERFGLRQFFVRDGRSNKIWFIFLVPVLNVLMALIALVTVVTDWSDEW